MTKQKILKSLVNSKFFPPLVDETLFAFFSNPNQLLRCAKENILKQVSMFSEVITNLARPIPPYAPMNSTVKGVFCDIHTCQLLRLSIVRCNVSSRLQASSATDLANISHTAALLFDIFQAINPKGSLLHCRVFVISKSPPKNP